MSTPYDYSTGTADGRRTSSGATDGSYVFELGHAGGRSADHVGIGDSSGITQQVPLDTTELLVRCDVIVVEPTSADLVAWDVVGQVDGTEMFRRRLEPLGRALTLTDLAISLADAANPCLVTFRLEAVAP